MTAMICPACGDERGLPLVDLGEVPALLGVLWDNRAEAQGAARGRMDLVYCPSCAHVWNRAFDPRLVEYDGRYDNTLHYSPTFQTYADELANRLVAGHDLRGKHVLEIGSGKGEFLALLCELGGNRGTGYDPTYAGGSGHPAVEFVHDYFPVGQAPAEPFDLLVCRHVLEHLQDPAMFLTGLAASARAAGTQPVFYFEVPSAGFNFGPSGLWDCIYPHVSYFGAASLRRLIERSGFEVLTLGEAFHGQFLAVEAVVADAIPQPGPDDATDDVSDHLDLLGSFVQRYREAVSAWRDRLAEQERTGERLALWGAGSKGVVFLNAVDEAARLDAVVDLNPGKWERHLPGTGHRVTAPDGLPAATSTVLVTNPAYVSEISEQLSRMGVAADVLVV